MRAQGISVLVWMSAIICILGSISGYYHRDCWLFFIALIIVATWFFAKWKGSRTLPDPED
jgi:hypothetical protein